MKQLFEKWKAYTQDCDDAKDSEESIEEEVIEEMSSVGGGGVQGYAGSPLGSEEDNEEFNENEKNSSKLKGKNLQRCIPPLR